MKNFIWIILIFFAGSALAEELYFFGGGFSRISRKSDTFDFSRLDSDLTAKESISSEKANFIAGLEAGLGPECAQSGIPWTGDQTLPNQFELLCGNHRHRS